MSPRPPFPRYLVLGAVLTFCTAPSAHAAWPNNPNVNVPLCTATGNQYGPSTVSDGAGGAIVAWIDQRSGPLDIYVRRVNAAGTPQWTADGVALCTATGDQWSPAIASDGAGGAIVSWYDYRSGNADIYAQRVNAAGTPQWTANGVALCSATGDQESPTLVSDGAGGAIVTWQDYRSGTNYDIYAQRVNAAGTPQWTANGVALCSQTATQTGAEIASDGAGGAIVTWQDYRSGTNWDIYAQRVNASGTPQWTANGVALCTAASDQVDLTLVSDGAGGVIVTWQDYRSGTNYDIYAQRVNATGTPQWTANGVALCTATGNQGGPILVSDGAGGAIVAWGDYRSGNFDIYSQRVNATGAPLWTANGIALCTAAGNQDYPTIASDGAGGAIVTWRDYRSGSSDIYAQRVNAAGTVQWTANCVALCTATGNQDVPSIVSDGAGGAIVSWPDYRSGNYDIYAQRVERFGQIGNPEPTITRVRDVPNDQGGFVQLEWTASYLDAFPDFAIADYSVWRRVPNGPGAGAAPAAPAAGHTAGSRPSRIATGEGSQAIFWEYLATLPARGLPGYSYVAPTTSDSLPGSNPYTSFMVMAEQAGGIPYWMSDPDSGYSVDNLAPPVPAPFTGQYAGGTATLHWGLSSAPDFAVFRLYRGSTPGFVPGPGNLVVSQADTGFVDVAGAPYYYKLSAVDVHGNAGPFAFLQPAGTVDVPRMTLPSELALGPPSPNPLREAATLHFALPRPARVSLTLYDQQGRRVRSLVEGMQPAGQHAVTWDGRDDGGRVVPSGLYFVRLEVEGRALTRRVAAVR